MAIVAPHAVQYHAPLYRVLAALPFLDLTVLYLDTLGATEIRDPEFGTPHKWDIPLFGGYRHRFLRNLAKNPLGGFLSRVNPGLLVDLVRNRYDVVLIHGYSTLSYWLALGGATLTSAKVIWRGEVVSRPGAEGDGDRSIRRRAARWFLKRCDAVLYSCEGNRAFLRANGIDEHRMFPFPCAVDNAFMQESRARFQPLRSKTRRELGIPEGRLVVVMCGRLTERKRPMDLLRALAAMEGRAVTTIFVGNGPQRAELKAFAGANLIDARFIGFVGQRELGRYYSIADVFAVISDYDPSPKSLNEAMNFGLAVVGTGAVGTSKDLIREGVNGYVVGVGDIAAVARRLSALEADRHLCERMGRASEEIVRGFNFQADAAGLELACRSVLPGRWGARAEAVEVSG